MKSDRTEPFIPLTASPLPDGRHPDLRVTVLKPSDTPQPFQPLVTSGPPPAGGTAFTPRPATAACEPRVSVEREGDAVSAIRVQCSCGQIIELACVYEPRPAQG
jgi:hypothetical protein